MDIKHVLSCNPLQPAYTTVRFDEPRDATSGGMDRTRGRPRGDRACRWRLRLRQRISPPRHPLGALRPGRPPHHLWGVAGLHGRRRVRTPRPVALRRLGHDAGRGVGGTAVLVQGRRRLVGVHTGGPTARRPGRARVPHQLLRSRRLRPLGRGAHAHRGRVGGSGGGPRLGRAISSTCRSCTRGRQPKTPRSSATCGSGPRAPTARIQGFTPHRGRSASTTASSW